MHLSPRRKEWARKLFVEIMGEKVPKVGQKTETFELKP